MKKENIQSRNRKLSAKARKKGSTSYAPSAADMLKPFEKMYSSYAGMAAMGSMPTTYYMPQSAGMSMQSNPSTASAAAAASQFGGMHMMAASSAAAFGGFGASNCPPSFGGMVRDFLD